jgi:hypothetical protein
MAVDSGRVTPLTECPRRLVPAATGSGVTAAVAINVRLSPEDAAHPLADSPTPAPASEVR